MSIQEIQNRLDALTEIGSITPDERILVSESIIDLSVDEDISEEDSQAIDVLFEQLNALIDDDSEILQAINDEQGLAYKIWPLAVEPRPPFTDPSGLDYKTNLSKRLHPAMTMVKGELVKVEYFRDYDGDAYNNKILSVDIDWQRSESGRLVKRTETRQWVVDSEEVEFGSHVKTTEKHYTPQLAALADARRRKNIVDDLTSQADAFGVLPYVQTMFRSLDNELNAYEKTGDKKIIEKINSYSGAWLDTPVPNEPYTLRQAIIGGLTI